MREMNASPEVSVIVPVRDRRRLVARTLEALAAQTFARERFEVVVVDDGSTDGSGAEALAAGSRLALDVRVVDAEGRGAVRARNLGARFARGSVLAFTDSDCRPAPHWLAEGVRALEGSAIVQGRTIPDPGQGRGPLDRSIETGQVGLFDTCNVLCRREAFEAAGGFDEDLADALGLPRTRRQRAYGFGEDSDLGWRVARSGGTVAFAPRALVHHHVFPPALGEAVSRTWLAGAFPGLVRRIPELRRTLLHRGLFLTPDRPWFYLALGAAIGWRRRPWLAVLAVPYVVRRFGTLPGRRAERLAALPAVAALDAVATAGLVVGSLSTLTPVL